MSLRPSLAFLVIVIGALPIAAQSDPAPAVKTQDPAPASAPTTSTNPAPAKKIWTNENLSEARGNVSVVGDKRNQKYSMGSGTPADGATIERLRQNLKKLQGQLDGVNKQLASYKDFEEGEAVSTNAREMTKGISRMPVDQQMVKLKEKGKQLKQQIDELLDEARKKGVLPGQLRQEP